MKNAFLFLTITMSLFLFWSCEKENPTPPDDTIDSFDDGVFITCEGAFGQGNAVVYYLDLQRSQYVPEIYNTVNQKPVGDVLQSMEFEDEKAYLVVNNSGRIIEVTKNSFAQTGSIEGLSSPTEIEVEDGKGYIGSLYSQHILVADMSSMSITDSIFLGVQSNLVHEEDNRLWVLSQSEFEGRVKNHIYYINMTDHTVDSVAVGANPLHWAFGDDDKLYVYCQGTESGDPPSIYTIQTENQNVELKIDLDVPGGYFSRLAFDDFSDRLLVQLPLGIHTIESGGTVSASPLISLQDIQFLYAMDVAPGNGDIYIGDAHDFASAGAVYIFNNNGQPISSIPSVGIAPNHFYFE